MGTGETREGNQVRTDRQNNRQDKAGIIRINRQIQRSNTKQSLGSHTVETVMCNLNMTNTPSGTVKAYY